MLVVAAGYKLAVLVRRSPEKQQSRKRELNAISSADNGRVGGLLHKHNSF